MKHTVFPLIALIALPLWLAVPESARARQSPAFSGPCAVAAKIAEDAKRLPRLLLHAVSLAESGRFDKAAQAKTAWPWTINAAGKGKYFRTKGEAIAEIRRLNKLGIRNIDVGCMQINLIHHGKAFTTLEEALDPVNNVAYAAVLLRSLRDTTGSWAHAVGRYHNSRWKERGQGYWRKVRRLWITERKREWRDRREARLGRGTAAYARNNSYR